MSRPSVDLRRGALELAGNGRHVLPCHSIDPAGQCTCRQPDCSSPGKHPLLRRGLLDATDDPATIDRWWDRWPWANVAIRTGAVSDLVVIDVDPPEGVDSLGLLESRHGLPRTLTVATGSGGIHLYFRHPGLPVANRASSVLGPGIDVRGDGGYVIAPPSLHQSGRRYELESARLPHLPPTWLTALLVQLPDRVAPSAGSPIRIDRGVSAWAQAVFDREVTRVVTAAAGHRNHELNRSSFVLGQLVGGGHLDHDDVSSTLVDAGRQAGLSPRECVRTVASGLSAGQRSPRHPPERPGRAPVQIPPNPPPPAPARTVEAAGAEL